MTEVAAAMPEGPWSWVVQLGAVGALILLLWALRQGWFRTSQEVDARKEFSDQIVAVLKEQVNRSNAQVDTILPALQRLIDAVEKIADTLEERNERAR